MKRPAHHPEYLRRIHVLEPLLRQYKPLAVLEFDDIADWISWYWNRGTISYVIDDFNQPQGVCLIKLFGRLRQFADLVHQPCGQFVMLELMVANHPLAMGQIYEDLVNRWGPQRLVMWDRGNRTEYGAPRMYSWPQFEKIARRITYGITENA